MNKNTNANQASVMNTRNTNMRLVQPTSARNTSSGNVSKSYSGSNVFGIVLLVVIIILIAGACYWAYTVYSNRTFQTSTSVEVLADVKNAASKFAVGSGSIPNSKYSNEYSISMWLNILDYTYNYGKEKVILRRGTAGSSNLEIVLGDKNNDLIVRIKQQGPTPSSSMTVSKFADVAPQIQTHQNNTNTPIDINTRYIHGTEGNPYIINNCVANGGNTNGGKAFEKISGNQIDYPTIKYDIAGGCDNVLTTLKPADAMTIMLEQSFRMKEEFNGTSYNGDLQQLGRIDTAKVSDNSAPVESQVLDNNYFNMVSGNTIIPSGKKERYSNIPSLDNTKEKFEITLPATTTPATPATSTIVSSTTIPETTTPQTATCLIDSTLNQDPTVGTCIYKMIPLQKWVHVIVSVYNQVVDIYIDGQLASSCVLKGFPAISTDDVDITPDGGFSGQISRVSFSNTAMTVPKALSLYYDGPVPSTSLFSMIPTWVWYGIILLIAVAIIYSIFM